MKIWIKLIMMVVILLSMTTSFKHRKFMTKHMKSRMSIRSRNTNTKFEQKNRNRVDNNLQLLIKTNEKKLNL